MRDLRSCERLQWNEAYEPDSEETALIRTAIVVRGLHTREAIANAVAEELFNRDCRRACYMDGFGFFRQWYVAGITRLLERLEGRAVIVEHGR
jgi:hypothetical protein